MGSPDPLTASVLRHRPYVLIEPEEVGWVVASLDRSEPLEGRPWVGLADAPLPLVAQEVDVRGALTLAQRRRERGDPVLVHRRLIGALVERGDVHHDARAAVGERGGLSWHSGHRPPKTRICATAICALEAWRYSTIVSATL